MFCFSLDSILLADFVKPNYNTKNIIDLGCGNAPIPLFLTLKTKAKITGIEIQTAVYDLAKRSIELNHFEKQIQIINADIKDLYRSLGANTFDLVIANPPYFKYKEGSNINHNDYLTIARHEVKINLQDLIIEARRLLKNTGSFNLVHRTERLAEVIRLLHEAKFGVKRMRFVYSKQESNALLFLVEAKADMKDDVRIEKPLYIYEGSEYSAEVKEIFNYKKNIE